jgi:hypothetical protein
MNRALVDQIANAVLYEGYLGLHGTIRGLRPL